MKLRKDNKAQSDAASKGVALVVGIAILGILASIMIPVAVNALYADTSYTANQQDTGETLEINGELNATLDSVDDTGGNATYTLNTSDQSITKTIDEGTNKTYSFDRGDVTVTVDTVNTANATATFDYPRDFAYSAGASALWGILGLILILAAFLYVIGFALRAK